LNVKFSIRMSVGTRFSTLKWYYTQKPRSVSFIAYLQDFFFFLERLSFSLCLLYYVQDRFEFKVPNCTSPRSKCQMLTLVFIF
jgi:hypothetical protein